MMKSKPLILFALKRHVSFGQTVAPYSEEDTRDKFHN